jgi:hypothetical protein
MFLKPYPIARIEIAAGAGISGSVLGFAQGRSGDLLADDGPARDRVVEARNFHLMFRSKKKISPGFSRRFPSWNAALMLNGSRGQNPVKKLSILLGLRINLCLSWCSLTTLRPA